MTNFEKGPIDPRIYKQLATDMWYVTVSYLPIKDILKLPRTCKYFNEVVVWGKWSGALMWRETAIDEPVFKKYSLENTDTVLIRVCEKGAPTSHITCLLVGGAVINSVDRNGYTALFYACARGREGIVRVLLDNAADPNIAGDYGWSPLFVASCCGYSEIVSELIEAGSNINHASNDGWTALMTAVHNNNVGVVKILLDTRADVNLRNSQGQTALDIALCDLNHDIIRILEEAHAKVQN